MKKTQVFQVEAPNGVTYSVEGPTDATDEELVAAVVRQFPALTSLATLWAISLVQPEGGPKRSLDFVFFAIE